MFSAMRNPRLLLLIPFFLYSGAFFSFWSSVYPTSLQFTRSLADHIYLPAYFAMCFSAGTFIMGIATDKLSKSIEDFGLRPLLCLNLLVHFVIYTLVLMTVPMSSSTQQTDEPSLLIKPRPWICMLISVFFGLADHGNNTCRVVMASLVVPRQKAQSFAVSRIYHKTYSYLYSGIQSLASFVLFTLASRLNIINHITILAVLSLISFIGFWIVATDMKRETGKRGRRNPELAAACDSSTLERELLTQEQPLLAMQDLTKLKKQAVLPSTSRIKGSS